MKKSLLVLVGFLTLSVKISAQENDIARPKTLNTKAIIESILESHDKELSKRIDALSPGFAIGVMSNNELIHEKYYGLANIEHQVPITVNSKFYIASISKQITAAIIIQLELEGKLNRKDLVSTYLPELSSIYKDITIEQLMYHTSGIREYTSLMLFRGDSLTLQDSMSSDDAYRLIQSQKATDFSPGSQFRYSSSGYVLLAKVIENIESLPLQAVAQNRIFAPLKMLNSQFDHDHSNIVTNRVDSYKYQNKQWKKWLKHFDVIGDGGLLTTLSDFFLWHKELSSGSTFGKGWRARMHEKGKLTSGQSLSYAAGLQYDDYHKQPIIWHGGGMGAFIADYIQLPEQDLAILVMANRNDSLAFQGWKLAKTMLDELVETKNKKYAEQSKQALDFEYAEWIGSYFMYNRNNRRYLGTSADGLPAIVSKSGEVVQLLSYQGEHKFNLVGTKATLTLSKIGKRRAFIVSTPEYSYQAIEFNDTTPTNISELKSLTGDYCSAELEAKVSIFEKDKGLFYRYRQSKPIKIFPVEPNSNINWNSIDKVWVGFAMFKFGIDSKKHQRFLDIGDFRVSNIRFDSCNSISG